MQTSSNLQEWFGGIDIYIFDQLLKGRLVKGMRVLDAGCGSGRNLVYFLRSGYEVFGVDESQESILQARKLASVLAPYLPADNFRVEPVERMSWESANSRQEAAGQNGEPGTVNRERKKKAVGRVHHAENEEAGKMPALTENSEQSSGFDVVLSSAVLHFARDEQQWQAMVNEMWRVLRPGGIFFARLASSIGMENQVRLIEGRRYHLPDGSDRLLVDAAMLHRITAALGGEFIEPIKTTVVENMRAMTTWVVRKK